MKKSSFSLIAAVAVLAAPVPAFATQDAPTAAATVQPRKNQIIIDANGRVIGKVDQVLVDRGEVTFMAQMKVRRIPIATLSADGTRLKTSLTKAQLGL